MALVQQYGTLTTLDTLATIGQTIAAYGEDRAFASIDALLAAHNQIMLSLIMDFCEVGSDRQRRFGSNRRMKFVKTDELGASDAQKVTAGYPVGFPMELYDLAVQWTRTWFKNHTVQELAAQFTAVLDADAQNNTAGILNAIFSPTNYTTEDRLVDNLNTNFPLNVKALLNADGLDIPPGPNGEVFDPTTHTHYLGTSSFVAGDLKALIKTVIEHYNTGEPVVYIDISLEDTIRGFTGFVPLLDPRTAQANNVVAMIPGAGNVPMGLDVVDINNRVIGLYGGGLIVVKPWMPTGYAFAWVRGQRKPVYKRVRDAGSDMLEMVADQEEHPLRARQFEREMGFGIQERTNGAVLDTAHSSYNTPTIAN